MYNRTRNMEINLSKRSLKITLKKKYLSIIKFTHAIKSIIKTTLYQCLVKKICWWKNRFTIDLKKFIPSAINQRCCFLNVKQILIQTCWNCALQNPNKLSISVRLVLQWWHFIPYIYRKRYIKSINDNTFTASPYFMKTNHIAFIRAA